jgi:hypothetical protein
MPKLNRGMAALGRITGLSREFLRTGATLNRRIHAGTLNFDGLGSHKTNGRAIPDADKQVVREFWMSDAITRQSPNTKDVRKMTDHTDPENPTKTNVTKRWKEESHSVIFAMFKEKVRLPFRHRTPYAPRYLPYPALAEFSAHRFAHRVCYYGGGHGGAQYPNIKCMLRSFINLMPECIVGMRLQDRMMCACHRHENTKLAVRWFNRMSAAIHRDSPCPPNAECNLRGKIPESGHSLSEWLLCETAQWPPKAECVNGTCKACAGGLKKMQFCKKELELGEGLKHEFQMYESTLQMDKRVRA